MHDTVFHSQIKGLVQPSQDVFQFDGVPYMTNGLKKLNHGVKSALVTMDRGTA
jgi:hypothetical protein